MARPREELQLLLEGVLGSRNVYFQPPESVKLKYPCILYERSDIHTNAADNQPYVKLNRYTVTAIEEDPDSDLAERLLGLKYCGFDRHFTSDQLNHDVFTLYF
jgi:hypothetical protein